MQVLTGHLFFIISTSDLSRPLDIPPSNPSVITTVLLSLFR